jgi:hypothetical protein
MMRPEGEKRFGGYFWNPDDRSSRERAIDMLIDKLTSPKAGYYKILKDIKFPGFEYLSREGAYCYMNGKAIRDQLGVNPDDYPEWFKPTVKVKDYKYYFDKAKEKYGFKNLSEQLTIIIVLNEIAEDINKKYKYNPNNRYRIKVNKETMLVYKAPHGSYAYAVGAVEFNTDEAAQEAIDIIGVKRILDAFC